MNTEKLEGLKRTRYRVLARVFLKQRHRVLQRNQGGGMRRAAVSNQARFGLERGSTTHAAALTSTLKLVGH